MFATTDVELHAQRVIETTRYHTPAVDAELVRQRIFTYLLRHVTADILGTCTHIALTVFDRNPQAAYIFDEDTYAKVKDTHSAINADLDAKMTAYRAQVKVMSQAYSRLNALQLSKNPNKKAIEEAAEHADAELANAAAAKLILVDAQRAEHYIRMIPAVYKSQDVHDALDAIQFFLHNNLWNPRVNPSLHAATEVFLRKQFNK